MCNFLGIKPKNPDVVIYDVLSDVVCGGFALPLRNGRFADRDEAFQ
jgi:nitrogenase subunit NifH